MKLPRAELDYIAPPRRPVATGIGVLVVSLACAGVVLERYRDIRITTAGLESARALVAGERHASPRRETGDELKQAEAVVRQLSLPWAAMIQAVEAAASPDVALLQMEPDPKERKLRLMAEAKNEQAMLEYLRQLGHAEGLADVRLASHQVTLEDPRRPIQFTTLARLR